MISVFISREHGLIRDVAAEILIEINLQRVGQQYSDQEAAIEINGNANKKQLTFDKSPFLVFSSSAKIRKATEPTTTWSFNLKIELMF
jgi:hypothetical protein